MIVKRKIFLNKRLLTKNLLIQQAVEEKKKHFLKIKMLNQALKINLKFKKIYSGKCVFNQSIKNFKKKNFK